jgi:hypothetical protein
MAVGVDEHGFISIYVIPQRRKGLTWDVEGGRGQGLDQDEEEEREGVRF